MVYGYANRTINEYDLQELREVSITASADNIRALANFLLCAAGKLEKAESSHWHEHSPEALQRQLGCDIVVCNPEGPTTGPRRDKQ